MDVLLLYVEFKDDIEMKCFVLKSWIDFMNRDNAYSQGERGRIVFYHLSYVFLHRLNYNLKT